MRNLLCARRRPQQCANRPAAVHTDGLKGSRSNNTHARAHRAVPARLQLVRAARAQTRLLRAGPEKQTGSCSSPTEQASAERERSADHSRLLVRCCWGGSAGGARTHPHPLLSISSSHSAPLQPSAADSALLCAALPLLPYPSPNVALPVCCRAAPGPGEGSALWQRGDTELRAEEEALTHTSCALEPVAILAAFCGGGSAPLNLTQHH